MFLLPGRNDFFHQSVISKTNWWNINLIFKRQDWLLASYYLLTKQSQVTPFLTLNPDLSIFSCGVNWLWLPLTPVRVNALINLWRLDIRKDSCPPVFLSWKGSLAAVLQLLNSVDGVDVSLPLSPPVSLLSLCLLSMWTAGYAAAVPLLPTVPLICV